MAEVDPMAASLIQNLFFGAYWHERPESLNQCLARVQRWLAAINDVIGKPAPWQESIKSPRGTKRFVLLKTQDQLRELLLRGRPRDDVRGRIIPGGGFGFWLYLRPDSTEAVAMHIECGGNSKWVPNVVTMSQADRLVGSNEMQRCRDLLAAAAEIWQPDWAAILPSAATMNGEVGMPFVDWLVYISRDLMPEPPKLKSPASVEPCVDGTLIIVQEQPPDPEDAAQQRHVKRVAKKVWESLVMPDAKSQQ